MMPLFVRRSAEMPFSNGLQCLSIPIGNISRLLGVVYDGKLRQIRDLLGLSQTEMGRVLAEYLGRQSPYGGTTVGMWEWYERNGDATIKWKRAAPARIVDAYRALVSVAIYNSSSGEMTICFHGGWRRWLLRATCAACGREFTPRDSRQKRCRRCIH